MAVVKRSSWPRGLCRQAAYARFRAGEAMDRIAARLDDSQRRQAARWAMAWCLAAAALDDVGEPLTQKTDQKARPALRPPHARGCGTSTLGSRASTPELLDGPSQTRPSRPLASVR